MYSFPNSEPVQCSMSGSHCCFLTCIQVSQESDQVVCYSYLLKNFLQFVVIHTVKCFSIVSEAEVDVFLELSCHFSDPMDVGSLISGSSAFSKSTLNIGASWFMYYWDLSWRILSTTLLACEMSAIVWYFENSLQLSFFGIGMKTDLFQSCGNAEFSKYAGILSAALSQHHLLGFEIAQLEFHLFH